jgi:glyoxylase-like metal-dependent hydrolase (beta-lactamase superfamily II)
MSLPRDVALVLAPNPSLLTGPGTNSYVVMDAGAPCVVIDPGPDEIVHLDALVRTAQPHGGIGAILVTHGHHDHDAGASRLREMTGAPVYAWSRAGVASADCPLGDGDAVAVGSRTLRALHTPGHRFDHLCFLLEDAGALFAGDLVAGVGTVVIMPPEGDLADYLASLARLLALPDLRTILPGHGPTIADGPALLREYVAHRLEREQQVIAELRAGQTMVPELVASIYADVDPALHAWAGRTVTAHLLKLEREARATRPAAAPDDGPWHLASPAEV